MKLLLFALLCSSVALAGPARHPQYEPDGKPIAKGAVQKAANLFLKAKVSASGQWSNCSPALAVDGQRSDAGKHWACEGLPATLTVDMEKAQRLQRINIVPYWADGRIYGFVVEGSVDGKNWTMLANQSANSICAGATGFDLTFEPVEVRYVKATFLSNSVGARNGAHVVEIEGYASREGSAGLACGNLYQRYDRDLPATLPEGSDKVILRGWRGERVNAMLVASSAGGFSELRVATKDPRAELNVIRYTLGNGTLYGDILDGTSQTKFKGVTRPVLYTYDIPATASGVIKDTVTAWINGKAFTLPVEITVVKKTLPKVADWQFHLNIWQHPDAIARWHDVPAWSDEHFRLMKPYHAALAQMGQKVITATLIDEAWGEQTYDSFRSMVSVTKRKNGTWSYDFTAFDRYVNSMMELGVDKQIDCYTLVPWSLTFPYFDEGAERVIRKKMEPSSKEYEAFWGPFLTAFVKHLREKGWLEKTKLALDERPDHLLRPALAVAKKYAPELGHVSACNHPSQMNDYMDDVSYAYDHSEKVIPLAEKRRAEGKTTTFYVCCGPNRPNTFMFSELAESEWMPVMTANYKLDGFLRWAFESWVENPLVSNDFTSWPTGDTSLIYPGPRKSLRAEMLRDGIETVEKLRQFKEKPEALKAFTVPRGRQAGIHEADLRALNAVINQ